MSAPRGRGIKKQQQHVLDVLLHFQGKRPKYPESMKSCR